MTAYAEGYEVLAAEELITDPQAVYQAWTNGTVVRSWLQQLLAKALKEDPDFKRDLRLHRGLRRRPVDGRGSDPAARAGAGYRGVAVRPVPVPSGRFADHEGGVGAAEPVRRPRGEADQRVRITACTSATWGYRTSGHGRRSIWTSSPAGPCSSARTATARRISLRHCGIRRRSGSHRVASDAPLLRVGAERAIISTIVVNDGRELAVDLEVMAGRANKARLNRSPVRTRARSARCAAGGDVRARGPGAGTRGSGGAPPLSRRTRRPPGGRGSRRCAPTTTRCCGSARPC